MKELFKDTKNRNAPTQRKEFYQTGFQQEMIWDNPLK